MGITKLLVITVLVCTGLLLFLGCYLAGSYATYGLSVRAVDYPYQVYAMPLFILGLVFLIAGIIACFVPDRFF